MEKNRFLEFFGRNLGFIIGLIIGVIVVICEFTYFFVNLAVMIGFGFLGMYVQRNKSKVKETLKNIIDNHKDQKYTYQSILYVLKYMNMIGINLFDERSNGSVLSLVEYYYNEARQYCIDTNRLKKVFEKVELNEEPIIITKNVGKSKLQSKKMDFD